MAASVQKPLPAIPQVPGTSPHAILTDESQAHLSKYIRHILAQDEKLSHSSQDAWARVIQSVLNDLGQNILRGGWFAGLRLARQWIRSWNINDKAKKSQQAEVDQGSLASLNPSRHKKRGNSTDSKRSGHGQLGDISSSTCTSAHSAPSTAIADTGHTSALDQFRLFLSQNASSSSNRPTDSVNHLLLCVSSFESQSISAKDDNDQTPGCVFKAMDFALPDPSQDDKRGIVLYGLDEWEGCAFTSGERAINIVGGTFSFKGVDSIPNYDMLFKALRLAVYFHHSLLLEQHFLANSNVEMHFTEQVSPPTIIQSPPSPPPPTEPPPTRARNRQSLVTSGILSLISKTGTFVSRAASIRPMRRRSSDRFVPANQESEKPTIQMIDRLPRFSFTSGPRSSLSNRDEKKRDAEPPLSSALKHFEQNGEFISTSVGVSFKPPFLLARLADQEMKEEPFYLKGDEKAGLHSMLGWDEKHTRWKGISGTAGFVRHQTFSVLYSQRIPPVKAPMPTPASETPSSTVLQPPAAAASKCDNPRWKTFHHYSRTDDQCLGEAIIGLCSIAEQCCETPGCKSKMSQHEQRYIHDGMIITVKLSPNEGETSEDQDELGLWQSCRICDSKTERADMSDGTYLFSFSKYLETLVYSPAVCILTPSLCEHTTPSSSDSPLPPSRLNIIRHFSYSSWVVSFSLSTVEDTFELRVPRLQIIRDKAQSKPSESSSSTRESRPPDGGISEEKKILRREILSWWQSISERIDKLELSFTSNSPGFGKALPRLPSTYDDLYDEDIPALELLTQSQSLPPSATDSSSPHDGLPGQKTGVDETPAVRKVEQNRKETDPVRLLSSLRQTFQGTERALYAQLARTQVCSLNDVRWTFRSTARVAVKRLSAWELKHLPSKAKSQITSEKWVATEPDWWEDGNYAVPGGNIIVREGDWGSIIAFTLSSGDFQNELANMFAASPKTSTDTSLPPSSLPAANQSTSTLTASHSYKLFSITPQSNPDPDQDDLWQETEPFSSSITRKRHPRDPSSLLSLRDVLRHRSPANGSSGHSSSLLSNMIDPSPDTTPPSAWSKPAMGVSKEAADGEVTNLPEAEVVTKILHDAEAALSDSPPQSSVPKDTETHSGRKKSSSIVSAESDGTLRPGENTPRVTTTGPPTPPEKDEPSASKTPSSSRQTSSMQASAPPSSFTTSLTNGLTNAMRFVLNTGDGPSRVEDPQTVHHHHHHHGLLSVDTRIDEHPHINYEWTIGRRLKFSCTVYYAKQFHTLRHRCGLDDAFVKSLGRSSNWAAEGGKSKSKFWKTWDNRFIVKTLVDAWNVADLQVLVDLAPSYFHYMDATTCNPTVLAKLLGFYTIEIKNLESGTVQSKADLLVMENLFYEQNIVKTFDLKGIAGRKVKATSDGRSSKKSRTMLDGEWIEGQQRAMILVRPYSKIVLREALKSDSEFLAKSNIMDYSLLLGVDEEHKQIACGLVDTIGSYTFAKTLEYKAKQGLQSGKDVTVVPPAEYRERFVKALDKYFLACPDKWSRPLDGSVVNSDPMSLPSVL